MRLASLFAASLLAMMTCVPASAQDRLPPQDRLSTHDRFAMAAPPIDNTWWKHAVIYEVYPRSFQDSNGDGIGDLNGITQRLDYLQALGVDAIWISPMYPSPQIDFGYDISDYENVDPQYGTLADFDHLVAEAGKQKIRVLLDMVLNHTSDQHKWFIEAASSKSNPKRDWYVWNKGKVVGGKQVPQNNWESYFAGSAWELSPKTKEFYYHKFYKQQPDLNWRNPAVERAMFGAMQFWLDRGVAGYRLDAVPTLFEDTQLRDEPALPGVNKQGDRNLKELYTNNQPEVHGAMRRMRSMVEQYPANKYPGERVLIGETYLENVTDIDRWYGGAKKDELQLPMDMLLGFSGATLDAARMRKQIVDIETGVHGSQPLLVFDNHDNSRSWDRFGDGVHDAQIAKMIATLLLTTRSTALMYYGEELGMTTSTPTRKEDVKDPIGITGWPAEKGRDGERTPMQWDGSAQAGFSTSAKTWLPVAANATTVNVQAELADPRSLLNWHKKLIVIRRTRDAVRDGGIVMLAQTNAKVLSYVRTAPPGHHNIVVAMNMSAQPQTITLDLAAAGVKGDVLRTLMATETSLDAVTTATFTLPPYASFVGEVQIPK